MVKVIGIDPGTRSFDFLGLDDDKVILDTSILSDDIAKKPEKLIEVLKSVGRVDYIVGPSGYGLPVKRLSELDEKDFFLLTLVKKEELHRVSVLLGMQKSLGMYVKEDPPMYFIPGVIHLPTVPFYRKINRIDMGTADKLCCAVLGIVDQAKERDINFKKTSFILLEIGFGYTAAIAVENGQIVDGIGGTTGCPGFISSGFMDGELAYLMEKFDKTVLFDGGAASLAKTNVPEELPKHRDAWECLIESAVKDALMLNAVVSEPREILVSGRLSRMPEVVNEVAKRLSHVAPVRRVKGMKNVKAKEAAQGAAIVANGLAGGKHKELVEHLKIKEAKGTVLDYVVLKDADGIRKKYGL